MFTRFTRHSVSVSPAKVVLVLLLCLAWGPGQLWASSTSGVLLEQGDQQLLLTAEQLDALPQHKILTATPWTDGVKTFEGPLVRDVLALLGSPLAPTAKVTAIAYNGYEVEVEAKDYLQWDVILAHSMDGQKLTLKDKGPWWIVYPRDEFKVLQDSRYDHRWAWLLRTLQVNP